MQIPMTTRRLGRIAAAGLAAAALALGPAQLALAAPDAAAPTAGTGFVRLAHLSPNTPAVDVYLYSFGDPSNQPVLNHVGYGSVSQFQRVPAGLYGVAMRPAGASVSTMPVVSATVNVAAGDAYTVAALGPASGLRISVFTDPQTTPPGSALVQVIQASLRQNAVSVTAGSTTLASALAFGKATDFVAAPVGSWEVRAVGPNQSVSQRVSLGAGTIHTFVVLDGTSGLAIDDLMDAAGSAVMPKAGVQTGLGGAAAPHRAPQLIWAAAGLAVVTLIAFGSVFANRRQRHA